MDRKRIIITVVSGLIFLTVLFFYLRPITAPRSITEEELEKIPTEKFFEGEKKEEIKESWMGIYIDNKKVGYSYTRIKDLEKGKEIYQKLFLKVIQLGEVKELFASTFVYTDNNYRPERFDFILESKDQKINIKGVFKKGELVLNIKTKEYERDLKLPAEGIVQIPVTLEKLIEEEKIEKDFSFSYFDPTTMKMEKGELKFLGEKELNIKGRTLTVKHYRIRAGIINTDVWVDKKGIVKQETPPSMVFLRESREEAMKIEGRPLNILLKFAIKPYGKKIDESKRESYKRVVYKLVNIDPDILDLDFADQKLVEKGEDYAVIEVKKNSVGNVKELDTEGLSKYLESTAFIQCDAPQIIEFAEKGAGNFLNYDKKARSLLFYVYNYLEKKPIVSFPSALDVLKMKKGDCNEHSVLYTAALRALKIPSRIVVGLVFTEGYFYYHAWNALYLNKWVFADPTLAQFPADPLHIMLKIGGIEKQSDVMAIVGKIKIEVLEIE
jgi:hypothetical protein